MNSPCFYFSLLALPQSHRCQPLHLSFLRPIVNFFQSIKIPESQVVCYDSGSSVRFACPQVEVDITAHVQSVSILYLLGTLSNTFQSLFISKFYFEFWLVLTAQLPLLFIVSGILKKKKSYLVLSSRLVSPSTLCTIFLNSYFTRNPFHFFTALYLRS